jgi:hypothetical protein
MAAILLLLWILAIPGVITGIVLVAASEKTRKAGLVTLIASIAILLVVPSVCSGMRYI